MLRLARETVYKSEVVSIDDVVAKIDSVSATQINDLTSDFLNPKQYTIAAVGPITEKEVNSIFEDLNS